MSQWTYRAASFVSAGNGAGDSLAVNKPVGTAQGDLIVIGSYWEADTQTITPASGFTEAGVIDNAGAFQLQVWYKVAGSSEPATYTFTPSVNGQWRTLIGVAYSGGTGSGPWQDGSATTNQGDVVLVSAQTAPSLTTGGANRLLVYGYGNFSGTNATSLTGAASNLRVSVGGLTIGDAAIAAASATGTTAPAGGPGSETFAAMHVAFISDTDAVGAAVAASFTKFPKFLLRKSR